MQELIDIDQLNKKQFKTSKDYYDFLMFQIQEHLVQIDELKCKGSEHVADETADLALLAKMLALLEGANDTIISQRLLKFKDKILQQLS